MLYLPKCYFKNSCCVKCNEKIIDEISLRGVEVSSHEYINRDYLYDDCVYPDVNVLYIWLTDNKYYSDDIYSQKKTELEREILFLLTGILGGAEISCNSYIKNDDSLIINQKFNTGLIDESVQYTDINIHSKSIQKNENYSNNGSPILLESEDWVSLKDRIKGYFSKIDKNTIVSYDYYQNNSDLLLFSFKRFKLRLETYNYKIEEEKTMEKSIQIRTVLNKHGLDTDINAKNKYSKTHHYTIKFYKFSELREKYEKLNYDRERSDKRKNDIFVDLRFKYELDKEKKLKKDPKYLGDENNILNQVMIYSKELGCYDKLKEFINNNKGSLEGSCHYFKSVNEVNKWMEDHLDYRFE
jgi:hypothetical protein